jgi:VWFA-related protein
MSVSTSGRCPSSNTPDGRPAPLCYAQQRRGFGGSDVQLNLTRQHAYRLTAALAVVLATVFLSAQDRIDPKELRASIIEYLPRMPYALRTETRLVEAGVVVRDSRGRAIAGLKKSDFEIRDGGKPREITVFSVNTAVPAAPSAAQAKKDPAAPPPSEVRPRFVGLLFDDMNSDLGEFRPAQVAAKRFVKEGMSAGDRVAVFTTSKSQVLPFTADPATLIDAIEALRIRPFRAYGSGCPELTPFDAYLIAELRDPSSIEIKVAETRRCLNMPPGRGRGQSSSVNPADPVVAIVLAQANAVWGQVRRTSQSTLGTIRYVVDYMGLQPGNRMLLLASGGFLSGGLEWEQNDIISRALRGAVVVNSLDAKGLYTVDPGEIPRGGDVQSIIRQQSLGSRPKEAGNDPLVYLALSTGGRFFHNNNDLHQGFKELAVLPEITYVLGFAPDPVPDGKYHKLSVRLTAAKRYSVQARPGYFAPKEPPAAANPERRIDREVLAITELRDLPAKLSARAGALDNGKTGVVAALSVDLKQLNFRTESGVRTQQITFIAALLDGKGNFVIGRESVIDMAFKESTYTRFLEQGVNAAVQLEASPGIYSLRGVVEEASERRVSTFTQSIEIR